MSISGVGAAGSVGLDQILARMLSRLDSTNATNSNADPNSTTNAGTISPSAEGVAPTALTGTGQSALSDQIMGVLVQLQQQSAAQAAQPGAAASPSTADAQNTSTGSLEQQLGADISQVQHSGHRHHHHHGGGETSQAGQNPASDITSQILSGLDGNQDGAVSADEFSAAFATNSATDASGTNPSNPTALFAQIDGNGDGSVTTGEVGTFLASLAKQVQSDISTLGAFGQLAVQSYDASSGLLNKFSSGQSSYA